MANKGYKTVNLPNRTVRNLKKLRLALSYTTGRIATYEEVMDLLTDSVGKTNPALFNLYNSLPESQ